MGVLFNGGCSLFYTRPSDGKTYCFIPVPLLAESDEILRTPGGDTRLGVIHQLTFAGTLLPITPALSGVPDESTCISLLDRKSDQLRSALSEDRGDLLLIDASGYPILAVKPNVVSLDFEESRMVQQRPYTVVFEYEVPAGTGFYVREYNDSWDFSQQENDTVSATHRISAVGIPNQILNRTALESAKEFVLPRIGGPDKTKSFAIKSPFVSALVDVDNLTAFNRVIQETSDITAGSYEVNETWVLSSGAFLDDRTVEQSYELDAQGQLVRTISVNGTVQGYGDTTFDKFTNAVVGFETFVIPQIDFNATSGITSKSRTDNRVAGTVVYSLTIAPSGAADQLISQSISRQFERQEDGSVVQTVTTSCSIRKESASTIQDAIDFCFANNYPIDSAIPLFSAALSGNLLSISTTRDELEKSFSLTRAFTDQSTALWREEYSVDRSESLDTSQTQITIQGTVQGLGVESTTKSQDRFNSASGAFFSTIESLIYTRAAQIIPSGACISATPITKTLGINPFNGTITYSRTFESRFKTTNNNVLKEDISVSFQFPADVIAEIPIPGKATGPILQSQETVTGRKKTLSINYTMNINGSGCINAVEPGNTLLLIALAESDILVNNTPSAHSRGEKPESSAVFKVEDNANFSRTDYKFSRNVAWQYL